MKLDSAQTATILAALRFYQAAGQGDHANRSAPIDDIATNGGEFVALGSGAIDELCGLINHSRACIPDDIFAQAVAFDRRMAAEERCPTGDDYNNLASLLGLYEVKP